jgi:class 3 adenylate cyclase
MAEMTAPSTRGQGRRLAAAWFSDVVGSTEVAEELGDRRFGWLIDRYFAIARSALRRHSGREIGTAGDSMFAVFDAPGGALRAAFEVTAAVRDVGLEIRSGVHFGEVEHAAGGSVGGIALHIGSEWSRSRDRPRFSRPRPLSSSPRARGSGSRTGAHMR